MEPENEATYMVLGGEFGPIQVISDFIDLISAVGSLQVAVHDLIRVINAAVFTISLATQNCCNCRSL